jgi:hypothetical protein
MAMTPDVNAVPDDGLDGHTMEELGDYLDRNRTPYDASIENSAACRLALANMARVQELSWRALQRESQLEPERDDAWISGLLETIKAEVKSGRDIPIGHPDPTLRLALTEAAVRGMIRRAGDTMGGIVMGRCVLEGDVTTPGEPIRIDVTASAEYGLSLETVAARLRARIGAALAEHTELEIAGIDVTIDDVYVQDRGRS